MTKELATLSPIEELVIRGDLSKLNAEQRVAYVRNLCEHLGLNALTQPFEYLTLSGRLVLYARKSCTDQLRVINGVSVTSLVGKNEDGIYVVTATGTNAKGRTDTATGAVPIENLKGENRANAIMKAETKAKRRLTLSLCGLGVLDESEIESIPNASPAPAAEPAKALPAAAAEPQPTAWTDPDLGESVETEIIVGTVKHAHSKAANGATVHSVSVTAVDGSKRSVTARSFHRTPGVIAYAAEREGRRLRMAYHKGKTGYEIAGLSPDPTDDALIDDAPF